MVTKTLQVRDALPADTDAMRAITRNVWDGDDYLPFVWDEWLGDGTGRLLAATLGDEVVGLQHIALQPNGIGWVEGIRVREDLRSKGIGGAMLEEAMQWGASLGLHTLRLSTSSGNPASSRIAERAGFELRDEYVNLRAEPLHSSHIPPATVRPENPGEFEEAWHLLGLAGKPDGSELYSEGWTVHALTAKRLRLLLGTLAVLASDSKAVAIVTSKVERPSMRIGRLTGDEEGMTACCRWVRVRAGQLGIDRINANVPATAEGAADALTCAGFSSNKSGTMMLLHEKRLSG